MRPVVLTVLDGKNFILGTFDTANFQDWWKSEPFPGSIDIIGKPTHVYGQYHVCICKMTDGTYSIYRTKNSGKSWESVYNTADIIYSISVIDFGWVIASTSAGWIESTLDSGKTWTALSSFAPGCRTVINVSDDILFAHDTNYVWRSDDLGETWKKVLDCHSIVHSHPHAYTVYTTKYTGYAPPALCGYESRIVAGCGPYLLISDNLGETWTMPWAWYWDPNTLIPWLVPLTQRKILQLTLTDVYGKEPDDARLIIRVQMIPENKVRYVFSNDNGMLSFSTLFDFNYKSETSGEVNAYDVQRAGSSEKDLLAVINDYDVNNNPIIKTSLDGGLTWSTVNASTVTVYEGDPTQEVLSGIGQQTFTEEFYATYTWSGVPCHNSGKWISSLNYTRRGISHDMDILTMFRKITTTANPCPIHLAIKKVFTKGMTSDVLNRVTKIKTFTSDILAKNTSEFSHLCSMMLQDSFETTYDLYTALASRLPFTYEMVSIFQKAVPARIYYDILLFDTPEKTYGMETKLIDDHLEQIMNSIERYTPQSPDVRYPDIPYVPYDSRTQRVTL